MLVIDNEKAAKIERLSDKICYVFEQIVALKQADPEKSDGAWETEASMLMANLWELSQQKDVHEIYELFKNISNARTDKYLVSVYPEVMLRDKMIRMMLKNEYNSFSSTWSEGKVPTESWLNGRMRDYRRAVEDEELIKKRKEMERGEGG